MLDYHFEKYYYDGRIIGEFAIFQLGRHLASPKYGYNSHIQRDYYELSVVLGGSGSISANGVATEVRAGDIYISLPSDIHSINSSEDDPLEFDFFTFNTYNEGIKSRLSDLAFALKNPESRVFSNESIKFLVGQAIAEVENEDEFSAKVLEQICYQISIYLIRSLQNLSAGVDNYKYRVSKSNELCYKLMNIIDRGVFSIKELKEVAALTNYDYSYLSASFKKNTGRTLSEYFISRKMFAAEQLIKEDRAKLCEISEMLQYSSYYSFSRAFKSYFGVSPKEYRTNVKKNCGDDFAKVPIIDL